MPQTTLSMHSMVPRSMSESFVQGDGAAKESSIRGGQFAIELELLTLGVQYGQEVAKASDVKLLREFHTLFGGGDSGFQNTLTLGGTVAGHESILGFLEC